MRAKTILSVAAVSLGAAFAFATSAEAGHWRHHRGHHHHGHHHHGHHLGHGHHHHHHGARAYAPAYRAAPATTTWQRSYAVPTTVYQPVTTTSYVPVTSYRAVQSTRYVPTTAYRQVTQTCSCTIDGVTTQVPCAHGYGHGGYGASVRGLTYNRPGLFTSGW